MATREEMCKMINAMEDDNPGWIARVFCGQPTQFSDSIVKEVMWQALRQAEANGRRYNGYGIYDEPCTYWMVGDYVVTYLNNDLFFNATMLTEAMMDDLIIGGL